MITVLDADLQINPLTLTDFLLGEFSKVIRVEIPDGMFEEFERIFDPLSNVNKAKFLIALNGTVDKEKVIKEWSQKKKESA